ncbi:hypothetical protein GUJ93_ZPchr0001g30516 [Zizania palustris]|uniref:Uncharacterized protein n=1 Tax=Zizania palustris TaxID=103762 RepID=A0A8J5RX31_ZIZPA|nr:hypothetical protein GUJ93_ZPchr0001g30516 [Zizania palustris]
MLGSLEPVVRRGQTTSSNYGRGNAAKSSDSKGQAARSDNGGRQATKSGGNRGASSQIQRPLLAADPAHPTPQPPPPLASSPQCALM